MNKTNNINKSQVLKIFKLQLKHFFKEINKWFPKEDNIKSLNTIILTFCKYNPLKLIEIWNYYIAIPYLDIIIKGDFNYFENKNYNDDLKDLQENTEYVLKAYNKLRISISKLDNKKKNLAMKYVQILTKLSITYFK
jgi:hypothetical protein